uniref:Vestigial like family member 1 n=1 Tax=Paramormyrops kingsleyae TaxID=1676925 RepID=A0A3B3QTM2_9TELE
HQKRWGSPPVTVKADDQSTSVLFTYFQGDINSVVDEHFSRALNKASRPKDLTSKSKSSRQTPKSGRRGDRDPLRLTKSHAPTASEMTGFFPCLFRGPHPSAVGIPSILLVRASISLHLLGTDPVLHVGRCPHFPAGDDQSI